jgi:Family of unknown function (DUF6086)
MSCIFQVGETILWNPSNQVATLFLEQAHDFCAFAGVASGLGPIWEDECNINLSEFTVYVENLAVRYQTSKHGVLRALMEGFLSTSLVLLARVGVRVSTIDPTFAVFWSEKQQEVEKSMPR